MAPPLGRPVKISTVNLITMTGFLLTLGLLAVVTYRTIVFQNEQADQNYEQLYHYTSLADELRQSSEDLTRVARTYILTGDPVFKKQFFDILAIRNGEMSRPRNYSSTFWHVSNLNDAGEISDRDKAVPLQTLIDNSGLADSELELLHLAQSRSDRLVQIEKRAFAAMEGLFEDENGNLTLRGAPDPALAGRLLSGREYHQAKALIMTPIQQFVDRVHARVSERMTTLHEVQTRYMWAAFALVVFSLLAATYLQIYTRTRIISPLEQLKQVAEIIAAGDYKSRSSVEGNNELGSLSRSINHMADAIGQKIERLDELSRIDPLTRVHNRRSFMELLEHEMKGFRRHGSPLSVLMIDLDRFKQFNDRHGHRLGDEILKHVCNVCLAELREIDCFGRLGGEEFAVILPETNITDAINVAERIRQCVEGTPLEFNPEPLQVAISIGAAEQAEGDAPEALLHRADMAMYCSKRAGRNRVSAYQEGETSSI